MYWLRRRLGSSGRPSLKIRQQTIKRIPNLPPGYVNQLGFSTSELAAFSQSNQLVQIADIYPWRGDTKRLEIIAWWGSALGDIAAVPRPELRTQILYEAASFNLAVTLFDSLVEQNTESLPQLARALQSKHLQRRLQFPDVGDNPLTANDSSLDYIVRLFDISLSSAGQRFANYPQKTEELSRLLDTMYRSELGLLRDRFAAKRLPVVYIGALGNYDGEERSHRFFESLGQFVQLWDDWLDLGEDVLALEPNTFLGAPRSLVSLETMKYATRFVSRAAGGSLFYGGLVDTLSVSLVQAVLYARFWDDQAYRKTLALCHELLQ